MKAKNFDRKFDDGQDISSNLDLATARRVTQVQRRVNVDFPAWMIESLHHEVAGLQLPRLLEERLGDYRQELNRVRGTVPVDHATMLMPCRRNERVEVAAKHA